MNKKIMSWGGYTNNLEVGRPPGQNYNSMPGMPKMSEPPLFPPPETIDAFDNRIYFYSDIDREPILKLNKLLDIMSNEFLFKSISFKMDSPEIYLYVNSVGGSIFDALSSVDVILNSKVNVNTVIDGCTASAASFLTIVGKKRYMKKHSHILIHQLSSGMWGKYTEFQDEIKNLDKFMELIKNLYKKYTKMPMAYLNEILKHDLWLNSDEALKYGLADEILQ